MVGGRLSEDRELLAELIRRVSSDVNSLIARTVTGEPRELYDAATHLIKVGGKRLRPVLLVASGLASGADYEVLLPFAAAVELVHTFTLVHDDVMDNDDLRRGVPTVHRLWGVPMAITAGDALFAKAFEVASSSALMSASVDPRRTLSALFELARAARVVAEGQALDMYFESSPSVSEHEYFEMVRKKTGALIEASARMGALLAGAPDEHVEALGRYALNVGVAFQVKDDLLGMYGTEEEIGKPVFSDLREGKKTLLVIRALARGSNELRDKLLGVLGKRDAPRSAYEEVAELLRAEGIAEEVEEEARRRALEALEHLERLRDAPRPEYIDALRALALYVVERSK
ncbi:MAG: polyprenyl synthetase family protein [Fervidicoccaceae archaeon]